MSWVDDGAFINEIIPYEIKMNKNWYIDAINVEEKEYTSDCVSKSNLTVRIMSKTGKRFDININGSKIKIFKATWEKHGDDVLLSEPVKLFNLDLGE